MSVTAPFLVLDENKKMMILPLSLLQKEAPDPVHTSSWTKVPNVSTKSEFPFGKWVHVGCEVSRNYMRLLINEEIVGKQLLTYLLTKNTNSEYPPKMAANEDVPMHYALPVLHPTRMNGAKWFKHNTEVSTRVRKIIEGCFKGPWYSWKKVPQFYRDAWFSTFETKYQWEGAIDNLVRANFEKLTATRLKGMVSLAKSNASKPNGGKLEWILSEDWRVMLAYWRTPRAKATSEKARLSRLSNRNGLGPHRHRAGSRSYAKVQDVLEANDEDSSFIAVLKRTHQKPDGTFVDERARIISEKYDFEVQEYLSQMDGEGLTIDSLTLLEKNKIYSKIVEPTKQGWRYGLGSLQSEVLMSSETSPISPQVNKEVETLTSQVKELETELQKSRDENANFKNRLDALEDFIFEPGSRR